MRSRFAEAFAVVRGTLLGLPRSPGWALGCLGALLLPPALVALSPFPRDPDPAFFWTSIARWAALLGALGTLWGLARLTSLAPFLERVPRRERLHGETSALFLVTLALPGLFVLVAYGVAPFPGGAPPPPKLLAGLVLGAVHLALLGALVLGLSGDVRVRVVLFGGLLWLFPLLLPDGPLVPRFLARLVDVSASIGYPSSDLLATGAVFLLLGLFLSCRASRSGLS